MKKLLLIGSAATAILVLGWMTLNPSEPPVATPVIIDEQPLTASVESEQEDSRSIGVQTAYARPFTNETPTEHPALQAEEEEKPQTEAEVQEAPSQIPEEPDSAMQRWTMEDLAKRISSLEQEGFEEELEHLEKMIELRHELTYESEMNLRFGRPNSPDLEERFTLMEQEESQVVEDLTTRPELQNLFSSRGEHRPR